MRTATVLSEGLTVHKIKHLVERTRIDEIEKGMLVEVLADDVSPSGIPIRQIGYTRADEPRVTGWVLASKLHEDRPPPPYPPVIKQDNRPNWVVLGWLVGAAIVGLGMIALLSR